MRLQMNHPFQRHPSQVGPDFPNIWLFSAPREVPISKKRVSQRVMAINWKGKDQGNIQNSKTHSRIPNSRILEFKLEPLTGLEPATC